jgi:hypothetical protein
MCGNGNLARVLVFTVMEYVTICIVSMNQTVPYAGVRNYAICKKKRRNYELLESKDSKMEYSKTAQITKERKFEVEFET